MSIPQSQHSQSVLTGAPPMLPQDRPRRPGSNFTARNSQDAFSRTRPRNMAHPDHRLQSWHNSKEGVKVVPASSPHIETRDIQDQDDGGWVSGFPEGQQQVSRFQCPPTATNVQQPPLNDTFTREPSLEKQSIETALPAAPAKDAWDHDTRLEAWANSVSALPPPEVDDVPSVSNRTPSLPERPDSVLPVLPATTAYVSEDEDTSLSVYLKAQTSMKDKPNAPQTPPVLSVSTAIEGHELHLGNEDDDEPKEGNLWKRGDANGLVSQDREFYAQRGGMLRASNKIRHTDEHRAYYKRPPHPIYHPKFADRRLFVQFPYPIRNDVMRQGLHDHFSRYGVVWRAVPHDSHRDAAEKAYVIFEDRGSLKRCLEDPRRCDFQLRSPTRLGSTSLELRIEHFSSLHNTRTVFIRVAGDRADARSRSASPDRVRRVESDDATQQSREARHDLPFEIQALPAKVTIYAAPVRFWRNDRIVWWARVLSSSSSWDNVVNKTMADTGNEPVILSEVDLRKRVAEKDFVPLLCDYFAEICEIFPPTNKEQGWLVCVGGPNDGRHLMDEMAKIPGLIVRWANEGDGIWQYENGSQASDEKRASSPLTRLEEHTDGPLARRDRPLNAETQSSDNTTPSCGAVQVSTQQQSALSGSTETAVTPPQPGFAPAPAASDIHTTPDWYRPTLRRILMFTYKGRKLEETIVDGEPKYFDRAAVFVGRLVKEQETKETLFHRFRRYGVINDLEYNPASCQATYATARVLFSSEDAANRAINFEHGAVSFGSGIKVEPRKVLPLDVQTREMFMDHLGRPVSPSMVSQYSPPSVHYSPEMPIQPPPGPPGGWPMPLPVPGFMAPGCMPGQGPLLLGGRIVAPPGRSELPLPSVPLPATPSTPMQTAGVIPLLYTYGIGYLPSQIPPGLLAQQPPGTVTPPPEAGDLNRAPTSEASTVVPSRAETGDSQVMGQPATNPVYQSTGQTTLRSVGHKYENGVLKLLYDPEDLRRYRQENGIPSPKTETAEVSPTISTGMHDLRLLPVQSGGHDTPQSLPPRRPSIAGTANGWLPEAMYRCVPVPVPFTPPEEPMYPRPGHGRSRKGSMRIPVPPLEGYENMRNSLPVVSQVGPRANEV